MDQSLLKPCTAFDGHRRLAVGALHEVAIAARRAMGKKAAGPLLIFDDGTGQAIEIDNRGSDDDVLARLSSTTPKSEPASDEPRGRGRPKLGVVAREVTLLPRHWDWLNSQPGGASVALRKLVDDARRTHAGKDQRRHAQEAAYAFMSAIAGDLPGFEEATRALFANNPQRFTELVSAWPADVASYARRLAFPEGIADVGV